MATALVDLYGGQPLPFDRLILPEGYRPSDDEEFMPSPTRLAAFTICRTASAML